jgi:hypothetical protein
MAQSLWEHYDAWARHEAAQLKNGNLEDFKQRFKPVRMVANGTQMIIQDTETLEDHVVYIEQDWLN